MNPIERVTSPRFLTASGVTAVLCLAILGINFFLSALIAIGVATYLTRER